MENATTTGQTGEQQQLPRNANVVKLGRKYFHVGWNTWKGRTSLQLSQVEPVHDVDMNVIGFRQAFPGLRLSGSKDEYARLILAIRKEVEA